MHVKRFEVGHFNGIKFKWAVRIANVPIDHGASGDYTPADLEKLSASAEALVAGYISLIGQGGGSDGEEDIFDFVFDIFSDGLALRIPPGVNGQGLLDLVVEAMETRLPPESSIEGTNLLYLSQVVEALYKAGHNALLLNLDAPMWRDEELQHLHGTPERPLVLSVSGYVKKVEGARHCHLSLTGGVDSIGRCVDTTFDLFRDSSDWPYVDIADDVAGCSFTFHGFSEDEVRGMVARPREGEQLELVKTTFHLNPADGTYTSRTDTLLAGQDTHSDTREREPTNTYFVEDGAGSWKEVRP